MLKIDNEKFGLIMSMHFPDVVSGSVEGLNCMVCEDLKSGDCEGRNLFGDDVLKCMEGKLDNTIIEVHKSFIH